MNRSIQPLGDQIIIKTIPMEDKIGGIVVPDSAKGITIMGAKGGEDAIHFVQAEVIAVGPGKRTEDKTLVRDLTAALRDRISPTLPPTHRIHEMIVNCRQLIQRAENPQTRVSLSVKPGDKILYHPSVQKFDRKVEGLGEGEYFIILENSVLAVIEE